MRTRPKVWAVATTPAATLQPSNLKPKMRVATPTPKNTRTVVPSNSAKSLRETGPAFPLRHVPQFDPKMPLADILFEARSIDGFY
jgi:hypothetical protein